MDHIRENDFSRIDMNLLTVLLVLYREGSVSRAAEKLHLGQPAVSGALARLRVMFNDPLLVRSGSKMVATPRADALVTDLLPLMAQMQQVLFQPAVFDPARDSHTFRLGMSDWLEQWLMPGLLAQVAALAPGVDVQIVASDPFSESEKLQQDQMDVALSVSDAPPGSLLRENIASMGFCTLWHPQQLTLRTPLSLADYTRHNHLLVSYRGASQSQIDQQLALHGLQRRVCYVTPHFSALPLLLQQLPALTTVPAGLAAGWVQHFGLQCAPVPLSVPSFPLSLLYSPRRARDPALLWLLAVIRGMISAAGSAGQPLLSCS